jgi:hypothetical protein
MIGQPLAYHWTGAFESGLDRIAVSLLTTIRTRGPSRPAH